MVDYVVDLIFRTVRKNRDGNAAECNCTEESHRPVWHALGENRHFVTFTDPVLGKKFGQSVTFEFEVPIGVSAFCGILPLCERLSGEYCSGILVKSRESVHKFFTHFSRALIDLHH